MKKQITFLSIVLTLLGVSFQAHAISINASFGGVVAGGNVYRTINNAGTWVQGGQMSFDVNAISGIANQPIGLNTLYGWCIEPNESVYYNRDYSWNLQDLSLGNTNIGGMGQTRANYLRELYYYVAPDFSEVLDPTVGLALQIATWEIVRDNRLGNFKIGRGNVKFSGSSSSAARTLAQQWLDMYINDGVQGPMLDNLYAANIDGTQDMIFQLDVGGTGNNGGTPPPPGSVPLPAPLMMLLPGLYLIMRKRFKA